MITTLVSAEPSIADELNRALGVYTVVSTADYSRVPPEEIAYRRIDGTTIIDAENWPYLCWTKHAASLEMALDIIAAWSELDSRQVFWGSVVLANIEAPQLFAKLRNVLEELVRVRMPFVVAGNSINPASSLHNALKLSERIPVVYYDVDDSESVKQVYLTLLRQVRPTKKLQRVIDYIAAL